MAREMWLGNESEVTIMIVIMLKHFNMGVVDIRTEVQLNHRKKDVLDDSQPTMGWNYQDNIKSGLVQQR